MTSLRCLLRCLVAASVGVAPVATAHDTWLLAARGEADAGSEVVLELTSGMAFPTPGSAIAPQRVSQARARLRGETLELGPGQVAGAALVLRLRTSTPGLATVWVDLEPRSLELTPAQVAEYLEETGASIAIRQAWARAGPARRWRETYAKHAKTFVRLGAAAADESWATPTGAPLELVPELDPTALRAGDVLPVRLLRRGVPVPAFPLGWVGEGGRHGELTATDAEGRARLPVPRPGRWLVRGTDLRPSTRKGTEWESDFVTLTLRVR